MARLTTFLIRQALLAALLERDPDKRLGLEVCDHPWMRGDEAGAPGAAPAPASPAPAAADGETPPKLKATPSGRMLKTWRTAGVAVMLAATPLANRRRAAEKMQQARLNRARLRKALLAERSASYKAMLEVGGTTNYSNYSQPLDSVREEGCAAEPRGRGPALSLPDVAPPGLRAAMSS